MSSPPSTPRPVQPAPTRGRAPQRSRGWCGTLNNPTDEEVEEARALLESAAHGIIGREHTEGEGTPHLQMYFEFKSARTLATMKRALARAHWECRRGTPLEAWQYCEKEDSDPITKGEKPSESQQGRRTDLEAATAIVAERGVTALAREMPAQFVLHHRGFEALEARMAKRRKEAPEVVVLHGSTGTGKSFTARQELEAAGFDEDSIYIWHPQQGSWFDGYEGQPAVIFEEFRGQLPFGALLSLLDRYDCRVQRKGSTTQFSARVIYITSPVSPSEWYQDLSSNEGRLDQLERRITRTRHLVMRMG